MSVKDKMLIAGSTGLLGSNFAPFFKEKGYEVFTHGISHPADINADFSNANETCRVLDDLKPDVIINLVCLSNVDQCEVNPNLSFRMNILPVKNISDWVADNSSTKLVQISTDHIYDSDGYSTEDDVNIINNYALSKYCAEQIADKVGALILRVNFFGQSNVAHKKSFSDWVINSLKSGEKITLFTDVYFNPLSMHTLGEMIFKALSENGAGVFNLGSKQGMSKRDFAHLVARKYDLSIENAIDGKLGSKADLANRPKNMLMDCTRFEVNFDVRLPDLKAEVEKVALL